MLRHKKKRKRKRKTEEHKAKTEEEEEQDDVDLEDVFRKNIVGRLDKLEQDFEIMITALEKKLPPQDKKQDDEKSRTNLN